MCANARKTASAPVLPAIQTSYCCTNTSIVACALAVVNALAAASDIVGGLVRGAKEGSERRNQENKETYKEGLKSSGGGGITPNAPLVPHSTVFFFEVTKILHPCNLPATHFKEN